jgi:hypothetical protein
MALGATARSVVREVTLHGLGPVAGGLLAGIAGALATGRLMEVNSSKSARTIPSRSGRW